MKIRCRTGRRNFSPVKSLDWCNPTREKRASDWSRNVNLEDTVRSSSYPFGIIAAMSKDRVIGLNGRLPWKNIPEDKNYFNEITRDKILILGRKSFEEDPSSLTHVSKCIVLSSTLNPRSYDPNLVEVVPSFSEALHLAQLIQQKKKKVEQHRPQQYGVLDCWIAGGERIYEQALIHPLAQELHLTIIDTKFNLAEGNNDSSGIGETSNSIVRFPPNYRWDHYFKQVKCREGSDKSSEYMYKFYIYRRQR